MINDIEKIKIIRKALRGELNREEIYEKYQTTKEEIDSWLSIFINDETNKGIDEQTLNAEELDSPHSSLQEISTNKNLNNAEMNFMTKPIMNVKYIQLQKSWHLDPMAKKNFTLELYLTEYERLLELVRTQPYGALLQIKDLYEIIVKVPVLVTASYWLKNFDQLEDKPKRGKRSKHSVLHEWLRSDLSIGDWSLAATNMFNILDKNKPDMQPVEKVLYQLLLDIVEMYKTKKVTTWRNDRIGHGALGLLVDDQFKKELEGHISAIAWHFNNPAMNDVYRKLLFKKDNQGIYVEIEKEKISLNPFFYSDYKLFLFDSYHRSKDKLLFLDYTFGDKKPFEVSDLRFFINKLNKYMENFTINESTPDVNIQNSLLKSQYNSFKQRSILGDYMNVDYLTSWLENNIQNLDRGIFLLKMEEGMGKTTFVNAIDEWSHFRFKNKPKLPNTIVRSVYIESHNPNQVAYFKSNLVEQLSRFTRNGKIEEIAFQKGFSPVIVSNAHAHECKRLLKYYHEIYLNETDKDKLLLVIDGLDEITNREGVSILNFIPSYEMLPENVYILLTSRLDSDKEVEIPVYINDTLEIRRGDNINIEAIQHFIEQQTNVSKEQAYQIITDLKDQRFMYIKPYVDLLKTGNTNKNVSLDQLIPQYLDELAMLYGKRYVKEIYRLLALFCQADEPLTLREISWLLFYKEPDFHLLGMLQNFRGWLTQVIFTMNQHMPFRKIQSQYCFYKMNVFKLSSMN